MSSDGNLDHNHVGRPAPVTSAEDIQAILEEGVRHHTEGRLAEAEPIYNRVLSLDPENPDALHLLGLIQHQTGRSEDALKKISEAVRLAPDLPAYSGNLGNVQADLGLFEDAAASFERALALDPGNVGVIFNLGNVLLELGRQQEALERFQSVLELEPDMAEAHNNLGGAYEHLGRHDEAMASFRKALEISPDYAHACVNLGNVYRAQGQLDDAVIQYGRAAELTPGSADIHGNLGLILREAGRLDDAIASFRTAVALTEIQSDVHTWLAAAMLERARQPDVDSAYPSDPEVLSFRAIVLNEQGDREGARKLLDFDRLIQAVHVETPTGFNDLKDFNAAMARHATNHPTLIEAPLKHATRFGSHTGDLLTGDKGPVAYLEDLIQKAVRGYLKAHPADPDHPFLSKPPAKWVLAAWAVVMDPRGHQVAHVHPEGWLSGCYYVHLPPVVARDEDQAGWIEFGRPPLDLTEELSLQKEPLTRRVQPEEGLMVLFPSYFYHETIPFGEVLPLAEPERRISIAFDVLPAD